jgi:Bacterial regulatory protein, arsR family
MVVSREEEQRLIKLRRSKVLELLSQGHTNQSEISRILNISEPTVCRDIKQIKIESRKFVDTFLKKELSLEIHKALTSFDHTIRIASEVAQTTRDESVKLKARETVDKTRIAKLDLISNFDVMNYQINKSREHTTADTAEEADSATLEEQEKEELIDS